MKEKIKSWLKAAGVRAIKTVAQTALAAVGSSALLGDVDWLVVVSASLLAGILSMLTSIAGLPEVKLQEKVSALEESDIEEVVKKSEEDWLDTD